MARRSSGEMRASACSRSSRPATAASVGPVQCCPSAAAQASSPRTAAGIQAPDSGFRASAVQEQPRGDAADPGRGRTGRVEPFRVFERFLDRFVEDLRGNFHHFGPAEISPGLRNEDGDRPEQRFVFLFDRGADPHGAFQLLGFQFGVRRGLSWACCHAPFGLLSSFRATSYWFRTRRALQQ